MESQYVYQKIRSQFGRQCMFTDKGPELIDNFPSDKSYLRQFLLRDPVTQGTQYAAVQAEHTVNTVRAEFGNTGINHIEGGWPKDVNTADEEQTKRYRRKIEKDDSWAGTMLQLCRNMENCILQNNAVNIYQQYYSDVEPTPLTERISARTVNVFADQCQITRPVNHISWSPDNCTKLAITHCNLIFQAKTPESIESYIWDTENPNKPLMTLYPRSEMVCLEYNQKDPNSLVSGHIDGIISVWDVRRGVEPVDESIIEESHRDPINKILWIHSKSGTEFFTASSDGACKWWDTRKLTKPTEVLLIDPCKPDDQSMSKAMGISALEYEFSIPTRFMVGTENGQIFSGNRKGKTPIEKLGFRFNAHFGPVLALQRNAAFVKNFLSVGDWTARIWSEDCRESAIMWTDYHKPLLTDGAWSPSRYSVFFTTRTDGILDIWDVLQQQKHASIGVKICDVPLKCLRTHEMGTHLACGNQSGTSYIVEFSENLTMCNRNDKALLTAMFEREAKREKILEARNREIRLKLKAQSEVLAEGEEGTAPPTETVKELSSADEWTDQHVLAAEAEFHELIRIETERAEQLEQSATQDE